MPFRHRLFRFLSALLPVFLAAAAASAEYDLDNAYTPNAFPVKVSTRTFSMPVDPAGLLVVYPKAAEPRLAALRAALSKKLGVDIPFRMADDLTATDLRGKNLIVLGNLSDNRWALELYKRRYAFADASFPGKGGVVIHPAPSPWDRERFVLMIGVSADADLAMGFETFAGLLETGTKSIPPLRHLQTSLDFPRNPEANNALLASVRADVTKSYTLHHLAANAGICYALTGDRRWADQFVESMRLFRASAEKTGKWVSEPWTQMYFIIFKTGMVWDLIHTDPAFTPEDRTVVEEALWGFFTFNRGRSLPLLEKQYCPAGEIHQNHSLFMGYSLYTAWRYYTEEYGLTGLEDVREKFTRLFEGQKTSYRGNDDAGVYINYPLNLLAGYLLGSGDEEYFASGKYRTTADLEAVILDNRRDQATFGDVGGYYHLMNSGWFMIDTAYLGTAAWYYRDGACNWLYHWRLKGTKFNLEDLFFPQYASDVPDAPPARFTGILPVLLDDGALRWSASRAERNAFVPLAGRAYVDKMSFRPSFDPEDEYLLLDGTSVFGHGHLDGNTVSRLTWNDRIWLFDLDYIRNTPRCHNGVTVTRNGVQEDPPPLTELGYTAAFDRFGFSRTISRDYSGADWERNIIWKKGGYFLFLDRVTARREGNYRFDSRWRTRGDTVTLSGNTLAITQGDRAFRIQSADPGERSLETEPENSLSTWNYPYGKKEIAVLHARRDLFLPAGGTFTFASLMGPQGKDARSETNIAAAGPDTWVAGEGENRELASLDSRLLAGEGVFTDCALFLLDSRSLLVADATGLALGNFSLRSPVRFHCELDFRNASGTLIVPGDRPAAFQVRGLAGKGGKVRWNERDTAITLAPGKYDLTFQPPAPGYRPALVSLFRAARPVYPQPRETVRDFGFPSVSSAALADTLTALGSGDGGALLYGSSSGRIFRVENGQSREIAHIPSARKVVAVRSADLDGDGVPEILAGDDASAIHCFDLSGRLRWKNTMTAFYGSDASAVDIATGADSSGEMAVYVATRGWKLFAFDPAGKQKWEAFISYHVQTKLRPFTDRGKPRLAVGTIYQTPLNVVDADTGKVLWFTWEQVGDEMWSHTGYCGSCLTDAVFLDADRDGADDIVFGTKSNRVYTLNAEGATLWEANVGDEVTALRVFEDFRSGEKRILAATAAGDLLILDRGGKQLAILSLGSAVTDCAVIPHPKEKRTDFAVSTADGRVAVCTDELRLVASQKCGEKPMVGLAVEGEEDGKYAIRAVSGEKVYTVEYGGRRKASRVY